MYPSVARERSCVDCHNRLQPGQNWQLNQVMGAFSVDAPAGAFLRGLRWQSAAIAVIVFALIGGVFAAYLSGGVLSLGSLVGFITVLGIAARNGIMMVSHYKHLQTDENVPFGEFFAT